MPNSFQNQDKNPHHRLSKTYSQNKTKKSNSRQLTLVTWKFLQAFAGITINHLCSVSLFFPPQAIDHLVLFNSHNRNTWWPAITKQNKEQIPVAPLPSYTWHF